MRRKMVETILRAFPKMFFAVSVCSFNSRWSESLAGGVFGHAVWLSRRLQSYLLPAEYRPLPRSIAASIRPLYDLQIFKYASPAGAAATESTAAVDSATCPAWRTALGVRWLIAAGSRKPLDRQTALRVLPKLRSPESRISARLNNDL